MEIKPMPVNNYCEVIMELYTDQHDVDEYEAQLQLRWEKWGKDNQVKKKIRNEVGSMTIYDFQNAVDKFGISGNTVVDGMVEDLVDYLFKQKIGD